MILRLCIDGAWTASEFGALFVDLQEVGEFGRGGGVLNVGGRIATVQGRPVTAGGGDHILRVKRISYGSPGSIDLVGLGKVIEQLRLFLQFLIERSERRNSIKIEDGLRELELEAQRLRIAQEYARLIDQDPIVLNLLQSSSGSAIHKAVIEHRLKQVEVIHDQ